MYSWTGQRLAHQLVNVFMCIGSAFADPGWGRQAPSLRAGDVNVRLHVRDDRDDTELVADSAF